ncbi:MAG TPA: DNA polymerase IV [Planctomycetes bacterium]|nr:DNA polymerase IV [Planctomycetota bacterium]HIK83397.1 DNA polymerase IV [Planctomycetota bacterium]
MDRFDTDSRLIFIHADMDAFFAAVEILDDPSLAGKPLIIGHPGPRGVVSTASYEARKYRVHSALPSVEAMRRCPEGIWRSPRGARYQQVSRQVMGVFEEFTPEVEPLSLDEAFLGIEGSLRLFGGAVTIARQLRQRVHQVTGGLTISVGVAPNKFLAKLASDLQKPDGLTVVDPDRIQQLLDPLPVEKIWGVGPRTRDALHHIGLREIRHLRRAGRELLVRHLGESSGHHLWQLAHGEDHRSISTERGSRSISRESTFEIDIQRGAASDGFLREAAEEVARSLRDENLRARTVRLKVRTGSFRTMSRSLTLDMPTQEPGPLFETARSLLAEVELEGEGIRLLGLGTGNLIPQSSPLQPGLFEDRAAAQRQQVVSQLLDRSRRIEGGAGLERGKLLSKPPEDSTTVDSKRRDDPTGG